MKLLSIIKAMLEKLIVDIICYCSVAKSCPALCNLMNCSTSGFPVLHIESGDAIQPSYPLSLPSPPAFSLSQHQVMFPMSPLFTSGGQSIGASVLPMNIQGWFPLVLTSLISLLSKGLKRLLQHHNSKASILPCSAFFRSNSHICTWWLLEKP